MQNFWILGEDAKPFQAVRAGYFGFTRRITRRGYLRRFCALVFESDDADFQFIQELWVLLDVCWIDVVFY